MKLMSQNEVIDVLIDRAGGGFQLFPQAAQGGG